MARCTSGSRLSLRRVAAGGAEAAHLAQQARAARGGGGPGGTPSGRSPRPGPTRCRRRPAPPRVPSASSVGAAVDDRVEQVGLGGEVVQDGLLADAQLGGQLVERGGLVAPGPERRPARRRGRGSRVGSSLYQMVEHRLLATVGGDRRDALAGKRIFITGATGFLGTALVERLLRSRARLRDRAARSGRAGARPVAAAGAARDPQATTPSTGCAAELGRTGFDRDGRPPGHRGGRRRGHATASASTTTGGPLLAALRHRHPLRRHGVASTRRSTPPSRSTCSAPTAHRRRRCKDLGVDPPPRRRVHLLRGRQPPGRGPRGAGRRQPVLRRRRLARRGRRRPPGPRATPRPRAARPSSWPSSASEARAELGAAGTPAAGRQDRAAARSDWVSDRLVEAGRARAASLGWPDAYAYTKALGERALLETQRRRAGHDRAAVDHRVGAGRAPPGLDPRLPHGRAGHHLLRPRPAQGVPRRARGHRRRHPGRPGGRGHHRGGRRGPDRRPGEPARRRAGGVGLA